MTKNGMIPLISILIIYIIYYNYTLHENFKKSSKFNPFTKPKSSGSASNLGIVTGAVIGNALGNTLTTQGGENKPVRSMSSNLCPLCPFGRTRCVGRYTGKCGCNNVFGACNVV
jgi:hypothetical protein